jgi:hypothetical protein
MIRRHLLVSALSLGAAFTGMGCYTGPQTPPPAYAGDPNQPPPAPGDTEAYPTAPPPDPIPEDQPPAPGYGYSWIGGYWDWTGYDWTWDSGYWAPGDSAYLFIGPRFLFVGGRPVYYRPYWQGPGGYRAYGYGYRGRAPVGTWRARPTVAPTAWRAQPVHNEGWRANPGASSWRGAPAARAQPIHGPAPMRAAPAARMPPPMHTAPAARGPVHVGGGRKR